MAVSILTSNSGTTFLRTGGVNKIKIKSNLAWTFKLLPLNDSNDISQVMIQTAETEDEEIERTLVGTGTTFDNIKWINVVNDLGDGVKEITGQGTTYLNIRADENFTGKDLFAVGYAEAITEPNICDYTVFEQYGLNYYFAVFKNVDSLEETDDVSKVYTPYEVSNTTTVIPVQLYTNTKCKVTITGFSGINGDTGEEFLVGTGVTKTGYPDENFTFEFHIPENKTAEDITYTIRATSEEDTSYSEPYYVTQKGIEAHVYLEPGMQLNSTMISCDTTAFTVNYEIIPPTLSCNLHIFDGYGNVLDTKSNCNGVGAITYECGINSGTSVENTRYYYVSGETEGETFSVLSETRNPQNTSQYGNSNVAVVAQDYEHPYFYLVYNGTGGRGVTHIDVDGVTPDNDTSFDVAIYTNYYPLTSFGFTLSGDTKFIPEISLTQFGTNVLVLHFCISANVSESRKDATIYITNGAVTGEVHVGQNAGSVTPTPDPPTPPGPEPTYEHDFNLKLRFGHMGSSRYAVKLENIELTIDDDNPYSISPTNQEPGVLDGDDYYDITLAGYVCYNYNDYGFKRDAVGNPFTATEGTHSFKVTVQYAVSDELSFSVDEDTRPEEVADVDLHPLPTVTIYKSQNIYTDGLLVKFESKDLPITGNN